uniref:Uncharacterized protein n=1 Tax=Parascaris univalens TaxID=6257 RepID=A0A915BFG0_PARUN
MALFCIYMRITLQNSTILILLRETEVTKTTTVWIARSRNASKRERVIDDHRMQLREKRDQRI